MALVDSVGEWAQVALNAGALIAGGAVWKLYFDNLRSTIGNKDAEISLLSRQVGDWREKVSELEKRSPEVVERVLAERISIRDDEIGRLREDRDTESAELRRVSEERSLLIRDLDQTKGFRAVLAMEQPGPDDPEYPEFQEYMAGREDQVVDMEVVYMGQVGVDSGQLMITDPCYIDSQWEDEPFEDPRSYHDVETGKVVAMGKDFSRFDEPLAAFEGETVNALIEVGRLVEIPDPPPPESFAYSYNGACQATLSSGHGELLYRDTGQVGAAVVFGSGWGDGFYDVFGEKHDGRIVRVYVNCGAEPVPLSSSERDRNPSAPVEASTRPRL